MLSNYHLKITDLYDVRIGNVTKGLSNFFDKEKHAMKTWYKNLKLYLRLGLKLKKLHCVLQLNQSQWLKQYLEFNREKGKEAKGDKDVERVLQINEQCCVRKTMKNLRKWIYVCSKKNYIKLTSKSSYMPHKIFDNYLFAIR